MRKSSLTMGLLLSTASGLSMPTVAFSQDAEAMTDTPESSVIIVTAQKREQNLQDVPLAITAISGDALADRGIDDVTDLDASVPGLSVGRSGSDARPAIRGVTTVEVDLFNDPTIGFFVDGVYKARTSQGLAAFVDLERVEVLRGPQGTLFGRNTYGGSISLVTAKPNASDASVEGSLQYGNYNDLRGEAVVNVPLGPDTAVRFVGVAQESDGIINVLPSRNGLPEAEDFNDNDQIYGRLSFLHSSGPGEILVTASHWDQSGYGAGGYGYTVAGALRNSAGVLDLGGQLDRTNARGGSYPGPSDAGPYDVYRNTSLDRDTEETTLTIQASIDLGPFTLRSISGWADFAAARAGDEDFSEANTNDFLLTTETETLSQEFQLVSNGSGPLNYVFGVYYFNENGFEDFDFGILASNTAFTFLQEIDTNSYAGYGQVEYTIGDALTLIAGARYTEDTKRFRFRTPSLQTTPDTDDKTTFDKFTWNLGAQYEMTPDNMLYASVSTGFRSGGSNNQFAPTPTYGAQEIIAYEIGSKNTFADGRGIANISLFYNEMDKILANTYVSVGGSLIVTRSNAGSSRSYGAEAELSYSTPVGIDVFANATYLNAKYRQFQASTPSGYSLASGYIFVPNTTNQLDLSGNEIPQSPSFSATIGASYEIDLDGFTLTPSVMTHLSDSYFTNEFNYDAGIEGRDVGKMGSFMKTNATLTLETLDEAFYIQAFVRNIENKAVVTTTVIGGGGAIYQNYQPPRTYGIKAGFKF